jgi:hypothetical protein
VAANDSAWWYVVHGQSNVSIRANSLRGITGRIGGTRPLACRVALIVIRHLPINHAMLT